MISTVPWHLLVPSVAVAGHWYLVATPKPFFEVFETVRNITGLEPVQKECGNVENRFATKEIDFDDLMAEFNDRFQSKRTIYDRVGTYALLVAFYAFPLLLLSSYLPWLSFHSFLAWLTRHSQPLEVLGYLASFLCGVIARNLEVSGQMWGRNAAGLFVVSHVAFGTLRQRNDCGERVWLEWLRACNSALSPGFFSASLHALVWAAAARVHQDAMAGFLTMVAFACSLLWLWSELDPFTDTFDSESAKDATPHDALILMWTLSKRLALVSVFIMLVSQLAFRELRYMTLGAMCCGHIVGLLAMLLLSLGQSQTRSSFGRQGAVIGTFSCSILLGLILDAPSLISGGGSGLLFWFWLKCLEAPWANTMFKVFITVGLVAVIRQNPDLILEIMNPKNLYKEA